MELPRQPQPVKLTFEGEQIDIDYYLRLISSFIENRSYDTTTRGTKTLTIYPSAVNE